MKKYLMLALCALIALPMMAGKEKKEWNFTLNDEGDVVVEQTYTSSKDRVELFKAITSSINRMNFEERMVLGATAGESIEYDLQKNTKNQINPFAGNFQESMRFKLSVRYVDGQVVVRAESFNLISRYYGFVASTHDDSFTSLIATYEENNAALEAGQLKGKAKKEAADKNEDIDGSLNICQKELDAIFTSVKRVL